MRAFIIPMLLAVPVLAHAEIYKCVVNGQTVFSQQPCAKDAVEVKPKVVKPSADAMAEQSVVNASIQASASSMERDRRMRQLEQAIADADARIAQLERDRDAKILMLRVKRIHANNNLAGATWEQSLATEMDAVATQYGTSIQSAQMEKQRLIDELNRMREKP
ncbi:DUF4124 domain-containing protein [Thiofaba sp. EF100]|uniref:DUF4124 domain-containing protein n=1 Tax=Thiofaba sp. EF100 TaxID=3121274 RepID=UPI003221A52E